MVYAEDVQLDWKSGALAEGLACYGRAEFFLAHEHWESVWLELQEPERSFLQALIQVAAACHHQSTGNSAGAVSLMQRALSRFEVCPTCFGGIAVANLCAEMCRWLQATESGVPELIAAFPHICPVDPLPE